MQCLTRWSGQIGRDLSYFLLGPTAHKPIDLSNVNGFFWKFVVFSWSSCGTGIYNIFGTINHNLCCYCWTIDWPTTIFHSSNLSLHDRINWSTMESRKKLRLDLSLRLWNLVSFDFINSILFCFVIFYICLSVFEVCQCSLFQVMSYILYLSTLGHWGQCLVLVGGEGSSCWHKKKLTY